jgi:hypothetical protein
MKTTSKLLLMILLMAGFASARGQSPDNSVFWVVEGNRNQPRYTIVRFYNADLLLLKEEKITGKFLDIRKKKNQILLDMKLKEFLYPQAMANRKKS